MGLVIGFPVKNRAWVLPQWFESVETQGIEATVICLLSPSDDETETILKQHDVHIIYDDEVGRSPVEIDGHFWGNMQTFAYMSRIRNRLLAEAFGELRADHFFSLDSDILLPPGGLQKLLDYSVDHPGVISPAVNMTTGQQVWNTMRWINPKLPQMAAGGDDSRKNPPAGKADVIMAAMLIDREVGSEAYWKPHSQGEDVGYCLCAETKGIPRWWVPDVKCLHLMRKF